MATGRPAGSATQYHRRPLNRKGRRCNTSDHLPRVVDNTLVVLVGAMRKVHADLDIYHSLYHRYVSALTNINPSTTEFGELLDGVDLRP
jgi:hypothetical protein